MPAKRDTYSIRVPNAGQNFVNPKADNFFNCGKFGHVIAERRQHKDLTNNTATRVQYLPRNGCKDQNKALKRVLYEICQQLKVASDSDDFESAETLSACNGQADINAYYEKSDASEYFFMSHFGAQSADYSLSNCLEYFQLRVPMISAVLLLPSSRRRKDQTSPPLVQLNSFVFLRTSKHVTVAKGLV